ncbi:DUF167 domain-containing protein [Candidatus Pacearchaeota archaeon]|nr:DUF167 domain-containing protein [Candidatus Pacearchaeota archaeon]
MIIEIKVKPRSGKQEIVKIKDNKYSAFLKSEAKENKANIELINLVAQYFNTKYNNIKIKRGLRSKNKILEIS